MSGDIEYLQKTSRDSACLDMFSVTFHNIEQSTSRLVQNNKALKSKLLIGIKKRLRKHNISLPLRGDIEDLQQTPRDGACMDMFSVIFYNREQPTSRLVQNIKVFGVQREIKLIK